MNGPVAAQLESLLIKVLGCGVGVVMGGKTFTFVSPFKNDVSSEPDCDLSAKDIFPSEHRHWSCSQILGL